MVRVVKLYAISNQPYAKYVRLTFQIFLRSLQALFIAQVLLIANLRRFTRRRLSPKSSSLRALSSEREGALYVAQDQGYFRKYGLDLTLVQVRNGPVGMSALSSGESLLHWGSVSAANLGAIAEGADLVFVAGFINRLTGAFAVNPAIHSPAELKGKSLGVNSLSGGTWIFTMLTLDHWGLSPARDKIQMRALGDNSVVSQALLAGQCRCGLFELHVCQDCPEQRLSRARRFRKIADRFSGYRDYHATKHDRLVGRDGRKRHQSFARWCGLHSHSGKQAAGREELGQRTPSQTHR